MIRLRIDGEHKGFYDSREGAVEALLDHTNSSIDDVQLTPDRFTGMWCDHRVFSDLTHDEQVEGFRYFLDEEFPTEEIARTAVKAEMEHHYRTDAPADATPLESDRHDDAVQQWFNTHVNKQSFEAIGAIEAVHEAEQQTIEVVEDEIASLWRECPNSLDEIPDISEGEAMTLWESRIQTPLDVLEADMDDLADVLADAARAAELKDAIRDYGQ